MQVTSPDVHAKVAMTRNVKKLSIDAALLTADERSDDGRQTTAEVDGEVEHREELVALSFLRTHAPTHTTRVYLGFFWTAQHSPPLLSP